MEVYERLSHPNLMENHSESRQPYPEMTRARSGNTPVSPSLGAVLDRRGLMCPGSSITEAEIDQGLNQGQGNHRPGVITQPQQDLVSG